MSDFNYISWQDTDAEKTIKDAITAFNKGNSYEAYGILLQHRHILNKRAEVDDVIEAINQHYKGDK